MAHESVYEFIVVGAGPAGAVIASRLAESRTAPSVLLLEAGGMCDTMDHRVAGARFTFYTTDEAAKVNYRYKTEPLPTLNNRELVYDRGRGLGGSTNINIGVWDYGRKEELDEWARLVDDDSWSWNNVQATMKKIENLHDATPSEYEGYQSWNRAAHGVDGKLDVSLPAAWSPGLKVILDAAKQYGYPLMEDLSSGNLGMGTPAATAHNGLRVTSAAYLKDCPANLSIKSQSQVSRVLFEDKKAVGVELVDGTRFMASKEVILSAGAIDTPKLLLLSGIGTQEELTKHSIPVVAVLPGVGQNLKDHYMVRMAAALKPGTVPNVTVDDVASWQTQWQKDPSVPQGWDDGILALGYFQLDNLGAFAEFQQLDEQTREFLTRPQTASYELGMASMAIPGAEAGVLAASVILMNAQSTGSISLQSKDPNVHPLICLNYLQHPYDQRVCIEGVRKTMNFILDSELPVVAQIKGPETLSDDDILKFLKEATETSWHAMGTVRMGKVGDQRACVDREFRVIGLENLRVADMSVCPVVPSNHTQSTAYLVGEVAAAKLIAQYEL